MVLLLRSIKSDKTAYFYWLVDYFFSPKKYSKILIHFSINLDHSFQVGRIAVITPVHCPIIHSSSVPGVSQFGATQMFQLIIDRQHSIVS